MALPYVNVHAGKYINLSCAVNEIQHEAETIKAYIQLPFNIRLTLNQVSKDTLHIKHSSFHTAQPTSSPVMTP